MERGQALDGLDFADVTRLDRAEQGKEFIELHLCDPHIVEEVLREVAAWSAASTNHGNVPLTRW